MIVKLNEIETREVAEKEWKDKGMQEHLIKTYDYYKTDDGLIFEITKPSKLGMTTTIWYDDELPDDEVPTACYENFVLENGHNCNRYDCYKEQIERNNPLYFCNNNNLVYIDYEYRYGDVRNIVRQITKEEEKEILEIFKKQKEDYLVRLERYFKRYNKHIHARGYWVNR